LGALALELYESPCRVEDVVIVVVVVVVAVAVAATS